MRILKACTNEYDSEFYEAALSNLSAERKEKALRYRFKSDRESCILGDYLLRRVVADEVHCDEKSIVFVNDDRGKPYIARPVDSGIHISLSHSHGNVVVAADSRPIGIDIELIRDIEESMYDFVLSVPERNYVGRSTTKFFEIWTRKEAYLKCIGCGIAGIKDLRDINVLDLPGAYDSTIYEKTANYVISVCTSN